MSRRERRPYPPGPIEMDPLPECGETNGVLGLRCDREPGHVGVHMQDDGNGVRAWPIPPDTRRVTAWDLLGTAPNHPGGRNAIRDAAEAWRQWLTGSLVRMQNLDDTEQALIDALAQARCGQCRRCDDCRRDSPFAERPDTATDHMRRPR